MVSTLMRVCIAGSRDAPPWLLKEVWAYVEALPPGTVVLHGGAPGVDTAAHTAALHRRLGVEVYRPAYPEFRGRERVAPLWRNADMVADADHCAAFWQGGSRGTANLIANAYAAGVPVEIYVYP